MNIDAIGSRRRAIGAALLTVIVGVLIGLVIYGIYSTRGVGDDVRKNTARNGEVAKDTRNLAVEIVKLQMELQAVVDSLPAGNKRLADAIIARITALQFTVKQNGTRVVVIPTVQAITIPGPTVTATATVKPSLCGKRHCK